MEKPRFRHKLDLQMFAEAPDDAPASESEKGAPEAPAAGDKPSGDTKPDVMIPKARFDEVNGNYKALKEKLDAFEAAQRKADEDAKKKAGQFEELYSTAQKESDGFKTKADTLEQRATALEAVISEMLNVRLETIPEEYRDIIPENLTPEAKLAWIEKASAKGLFGSAKKKSEEPVGGGTNPPPNPTADIAQLNPFQLLTAGYGSK